MTCTTPANCLPDWARRIMDAWRTRKFPGVPIDDCMDHRRAAFYRLYCADDYDISLFWRQADKCVDTHSRSGFIHSLILATDNVIPDEPLPVYNRRMPATPRLRTQQQRWARKLAEQLQLLSSVTPARCQARHSRIERISTDVECLVIFFQTGEVWRDYDLRWRMTELGIEYTCDSERGWRQHRRASDKVRAKAISTARKLALLVQDDRHRTWLNELADELAALPSMKDEHAAWLRVISQKQGWWNWFAAAYAMTRYDGIGSDTPSLRNRDWATLARVIANAGEVTEDDVAHAMQALLADGKALSEFL